MESNTCNLKPVTKTVFPHVNKGRQASSNLVCQIPADFCQGYSPQKLSNLQLLLSMITFKVLISKDFWYLFRTSACTRKSVSMGLHKSWLWPSQSLMSWDSDILASVFLTRRAVSREAGLWAQHSIISFPIWRRHCGEKQECQSSLGQWNRRLQLVAKQKHWREKVFCKGNWKNREYAAWYHFLKAFVFHMLRRVLQTWQ